MYNAYLDRTKGAICALRKHITHSERYRALIFDSKFRCVGEIPCFDLSMASPEAMPDRIEWRIIDHCAAVTRAYAIYEQFVHEMIREHLSLLQSKLSYNDLPEEVRTSYRIGLSKILEKKDGPRYADIDLSQLIADYDSALSGEAYHLEPKAMLIQEQNLRLPELQRIMKASGVDGVSDWIEKHRAVREFFDAGSRLTGSAASELAELIEYRNDAAHGSIDIGDILHVNILDEFCEFLDVVCEALCERVQLAGLQALLVSGHARDRGKIDERLKEGLVAIGVLAGAFRVGQTVYIQSENSCFSRIIEEIQVDGEQLTEIELSEPTELGIKFNDKIKRYARIISVDSS